VGPVSNRPCSGRALSRPWKASARVRPGQSAAANRPLYGPVDSVMVLWRTHWRENRYSHEPAAHKQVAYEKQSYKSTELPLLGAGSACKIQFDHAKLRDRRRACAVSRRLDVWGRTWRSRGEGAAHGELWFCAPGWRAVCVLSEPQAPARGPMRTASMARATRPEAVARLFLETIPDSRARRRFSSLFDIEREQHGKITGGQKRNERAHLPV